MPDTPVFMVVNLSITDVESYLNYEKGFFGFLKKYGGEFLTYDDQPDYSGGRLTAPGTHDYFQVSVRAGRQGLVRRW